MSFRLFVYYCAVGGAWCGFVGWILGRAVSPAQAEGFFRSILPDCIAGMLLGATIAFGLSLLDAIFNFSLRQLGKVFVRVFAAIVIGTFSGLFGSFIGSSLYYAAKTHIGVNALSEVAFILGWTIVGFLVGFSISFFEIIGSLMAGKDFAGAFRKLRNCLIGGTVGGIIGGVVACILRIVAQMMIDKQNLMTPTAIGFIAIGACIGLLVGLAQILLKEAWIKVEAGFRPGRELLISKEKTTIGRAEGSDIGLFGDNGIEKTHASIVLDGGRYFLEDLQTPGGTFVNDQKVNGRAALKAGDLIRVGKSVLRFNERAKRKD